MHIKTWFSAVAVSLLIGLAIPFVPGFVQAKQVTVVTTLFPLYDWAKIIGGEQAEVSLLLPPGVESHSFEPKPQDVVRISKADLFIYTGEHMEPWAEALLKGISSSSLQVVDSSHGIALGEEHHHEGEEHALQSADGQHHHHDGGHDQHDRHGHHDHGGKDPHIWLEFNNAVRIIDNLTAGFIAADPANREIYQKRARE